MLELWDGILQPDTGQPLEHDGTVFRSAAHPALGREAVTCREAPGSRHASCLGMLMLGHLCRNLLLGFGYPRFVLSMSGVGTEAVLMR